jgi:5-methylcytosine-specific restriction endonuclease McrA
MERVFAEADLLSRKNGPQRRQPCLCRQLEGALAGFIFGLWTVLEVVEHPRSQPSGQSTEKWWKCRCACGTERAIEEGDLTSQRTLSCGCRPHDELKAKFWSNRQRAWESFGTAMRGAHRRERDSNWTPAMEQALRDFQRVCVVCGATTPLTKDHVRPVGEGGRLEPGNAVRLCRECNSFKWDRPLSELYPEMARRLEIAAAEFKDFWEGRRVAPAAPPAALWPPEAPDPALVTLLRRLERGDDNALGSLADWLEGRSDPRAAAIRDLTMLKPVVTETRTGANELSPWVGFLTQVKRWVDFLLGGKRTGSSSSMPSSLGDSPDSLAQRLREARSRQQSDQVWWRLGLSFALRDTLKEYLGITPTGVAATVEEIARLKGKRVQVVRHRIHQALHRLAVPRPPGRRQW